MATQKDLEIQVDEVFELQEKAGQFAIELADLWGQSMGEDADVDSMMTRFASSEEVLTLLRQLIITGNLLKPKSDNESTGDKQLDAYAEEYALLENQLIALRAKTKKLATDQVAVAEVMGTLWSMRNTDKISMHGRTIFRERRRSVRINGEGMSPIAAARLKEIGFDEFVTTGVNSRGLGTWLKEQDKAEKERTGDKTAVLEALPEQMQDVLHIHDETRFKSKKA